MSRPESAGALFRRALAEESPLQIIGAINANHALLAKRAGYRAIYLLLPLAVAVGVYLVLEKRAKKLRAQQDSGKKPDSQGNKAKPVEA